MEWPKLKETSFSKIVSSLAILGPVGAYSYVCIVTKKVLEIPQSFIVLIAILLGVKAIPKAIEMFKPKEGGVTHDVSTYENSRVKPERD